jgi:phosphate:Na+ symporter
MEFGLWEIFQILGSLAFFIFGMKMMSDGVQRAAGSQMRNILRTMTKNRFLGVFTGFLITALLQSSSATTVMTVSFVNAGLLSLVESAGVMMGANIGTTITGWIISLLGFKIKLAAYSVPIFAIAIPMYFSNKGKLKYWGEFLIGFAILFMGLSLLKKSVPDLNGNPEALEWVTSLANWGFLSRVVFVLIGAVVTVIVQSSSAAMAITLTMVAQGWLPLDVAAAMVLGENIGTTITAELASIVGNTSAKRSARIHSMFNIVGVVWMVTLLPFFLSMVKDFMANFVGTSDAPMTLAAFHTFFNISNVILLLGFVPWLVKAAIWSVPGADDDGDEKFSLKFIGGATTRTPELATVELQREIGHFGEIMAKMSNLTRELINSTETKERTKLLKKIKKYEEISDQMEIKITEYVTRLANQELTPKTSQRLRSVLNVCNDLERIGDVYYQISKTIEMKNEDKIYFLPHQRENLNLLSNKIDAAFQEMKNNLKTSSYDNVSKTKAIELEKDINAFRDQLRNEHLTRLGDDDYNVKSAMVYNNIFHAMEKVGDHIINVTEAVIGEI